MRLDGPIIGADARAKTPRRSRARRSGDRMLGSISRELEFQFPSPEEGLRLLRAFLRISDPAIRAAIIDWVSEQARFG